VVSVEPSEGATGAVAAEEGDSAMASENNAVGNGVELAEGRDGLPESVEKAGAV
jgi:hypothetical protein